MKVTSSIFLFILYPLILFATNPAKKDTVGFSCKKISLDFSCRTDTTGIDTSINSLHVFNQFESPIQSYSYLSRTGYPIIANCIVERLMYSDLFLPANSYIPLLQDSRNNFFYSTKKPFTSITYKNIGERSNIQDLLQVLHTQNITTKSNLGVVYNNYHSYSDYDKQKSGDHAANIFYRYSGEKYFAYGQFYLNSFSIKENGGIVSDTLLDYVKGNEVGISANLKAATSTFKRYGINTLHEYKFRTAIVNEKDSGDFVEKDLGSIMYNLVIERTKRNYAETAIDTFYAYNYFDATATNDSIRLDRLSNRLILNSPYIWVYLPNFRASINNDLYIKTQNIPDTFNFENGLRKINLQTVEKYFNTWISADISQSFRQVLWNVSWNLYTLGYSMGDHSISATARLYANKSKTIGLILNATEEAITPSFLYNRYYSNHIYWLNKKFDKEKKQTFSAVLSSDKPNISLSFNYISVFDFMYFNEIALPVQAKNSIQIISLGFKSKFNFWKFSTENNVVLQRANNETIISFPKMIYYNSIDFTHTFKFFTGGLPFTKIGTDLTYTSSYNLNGYMPSTGIFYIQNEAKAASYPRLDIHLTCKVKTVSFFVKYIHANAGYSGKQYFTAAHYPMLPAMFSYGINWLFYD